MNEKNLESPEQRIHAIETVTQNMSSSLCSSWVTIIFSTPSKRKNERSLSIYLFIFCFLPIINEVCRIIVSILSLYYRNLSLNWSKLSSSLHHTFYNKGFPVQQVKNPMKRIKLSPDKCIHNSLYQLLSWKVTGKTIHIYYYLLFPYYFIIEVVII
jgi:hypothetical protein